MATTTASDLRGLSRDELNAKVKEYKEELFNLRFAAATGQLKGSPAEGLKDISGSVDLSNGVAFTVAAVPTGMKAGVRISPRGVDTTPVRAAPSPAPPCPPSALMLLKPTFRRLMLPKPFRMPTCARPPSPPS